MYQRGDLYGPRQFPPVPAERRQPHRRSLRHVQLIRAQLGPAAVFGTKGVQAHRGGGGVAEGVVEGGASGSGGEGEGRVGWLGGGLGRLGVGKRHDKRGRT